jgi:tRNA A-37 threonylcarbamoyl transferase component Bud32
MRNQLLGGRYRILDLIGEGGMAYVYLAVDEKLGRKVAVNVLHEHMEKNADIRQRFQMEAQAVSSLEHPNIVKVYDYSGDQVGRLWIVTEVIHGRNLAQYVQQSSGGWLHPVIAAAIVNEICKALEKAHGQGIVHRDVKPENIMVTFDGRVKLMDFGIAKDLGKSGMTVTGTFMGSPSYMSPEQIRGRDIDLRSDLYSLSVLFYEIVTGRLPFTGSSTHDVVLKIMEGNYTHPRFLVPGLPLPLNELIVKGMARNPDNRCQSAREYGAYISQVLIGLGFDESHIELERYFKDREGYNARLGATKANAQAALKQNHTSLTRGRQAPTAAHRSMLQQAQLLQQAQQAQQQAAPTRPLRGPTQHGYAGSDGEPSRLNAQIPATAESPMAAAAARVSVPPPVAYALPPQPPLQVTDYVTPRRPVYVPRQNPRIVRRPTRAPLQSSRASWVGYLSGSLIVGLICAVSLWGLLGLQGRPAAKIQGLSNAEAAWRANVRASVSMARKVAHARRDGSASVASQPPSKVTPVPPPVVVPPSHGKTPRRSDRSGQTSNSQMPAQTLTTASPLTTKVTPPNKKVGKRGEPKDNTGLDPSAMAAAPATAPGAKAASPARTTRELVAEHPDASTVEPSAEAAVEKAPTRQGRTEKADKAEKAEKVAKPDKAAKTEVQDKGDQSDHTERGDRTDKGEPKERTDKVDKPGKRNSAPSGKGRFSISSQPAAEIYLDGRRLGTTIDNTSDSGWLTVSAGRHSLELRRKDYVAARSRFDLAADEQKALPRVVLEAAGHSGQGGPKPALQEVALTLRINLGPAQATLRNLETSATQVFTIKSGTKTVSLSPGRYHIRIDHGSETRERDLNLNGGEGQLTFSVEFKNED